MRRKLIKSGLCAGALALGAVCVYGETFSLPENTQRCADGACIPRRVTNGYYPTQWRRWPISEPAPAQPGVREGISAPAVEVPPPREETDLPQGALTAPGPSEDYGAAPEYGAPRGTPPVTQPPLNAPPTGRAVPRTGPQPPPELFRDMPRSTPDSRTPRFPFDNRPRRATPSIAVRPSTRPANVVEELREEARRKHATETQHGDLSAPAAPPDDAASAEPLRRAAPAEPSSFQSSTQWRRASDAQVRSVDPAGDATVGMQWSPSRNIGEVASALSADKAMEAAAVGWTAEPTSAFHQPRLDQPLPALGGAGEAFDASESVRKDEVTQSLDSPIRPEVAGPNTAAAVGYQQHSANVQRASATADLTISPPASSTVFAVRSGSDDSWRHGSAISNPLRGADSAVAKVRWEGGTSEVKKPRAGKSTSNSVSKNTSSLERAANSAVDQAAATAVSSDEDIPRNPLR